MTASEYRYMRAIAKFADGGKAAKMTDVAADLGFARASVYKKFCLLEQQGLIRKRDDKSVVLTEEGARQYARQTEVCKVCAQMLSKYTGMQEYLLMHDAVAMAGALSHRCCSALLKDRQ